ncbi:MULTISPECIES: tetratricopeptide repeat protein [Microbacterium]|uniref:tetratricopeptide repeat protein n=1 Tax=Microbacterium TaxID=33882 RepID=UPI00217D4746|nr:MULTISPECIES: tetratricopeptide repeat protein [Microbacterium]UWF76723.1 tetratricopeptide repeat protein [Microbacterium neungamense]WCM54873.1 tetratricopeptide repeat protein [Microbacterium sp. EF45047]
MPDWQQRIDAIWADDALTDLERIARIDALAAEAPDEAHAAFERAGARDSAGLESETEPLYRRALDLGALDLGLPEDLRAQAVIQLASTLRNLGRVAESLELLAAERERGGPLADAASAFYALALASAGDPLAAASVALEALAPHLPRYTRSVTGYARELRPPR